MSINHKELAKALRTIAETPKKVEEAKAKCNAILADVAEKERSGNWSPNSLKTRREEAYAERDRVCHALIHGMRPALDVIKANNDFANEPLDVNNPKLQNAINMLQYMDKTSYADVASLLEAFRGDPASLRFLKKALEKSGMKWAADNIAAPMMKNVSENAIREMEEVLAFHDYAESQGRLDFPLERARWTKDEFGRELERMGYDDGNAGDAYTFAIQMIADNLNDAKMHPKYNPDTDPAEARAEQERFKTMGDDIGRAMNTIRFPELNNTDTATVFNDLMRKVDTFNRVEAGA